MRVALLFAAAATAADWPSFRGPNGSGLTQGAAPLEIGPSKNVAWRIELPPGNSSPVLTTDAIFLTAYSDKDLLTLKIDRATGRIAWRRAVPAQRHDERHKLNNAASPTPVTDGRNVYSFFAEFGLVSYGPDGNERWRLPLGPFINLHGMAASPILAGDRIILRDPSATRTLAGARVIDPFGPPRNRRAPRRLAELVALDVLPDHHLRSCVSGAVPRSGQQSRQVRLDGARSI